MLLRQADTAALRRLYASSRDLGPDLDERARYIVCRQDRVFPDALSRAFAAKLGGRLEEMDAGHDVMLSAPGPLAHVLGGA